MFFLWFATAMLVLAMLAVGACCVQLISEDEELLNWFRTHYEMFVVWTKQLIVRYKHKAVHSLKYQAQQETKEWYMQSLRFSAT